MNNAHYSGFAGQHIGGQQRSGRDDQPLIDIDPFTGQTIAELRQANVEDVEDAYQAAQAAQLVWAKTLPAERSAIFHRAAQVMAERREEIVGWLIREAGSTRLKANIEWTAVRDGMLEAAMLPARVTGRIMPIDVPGKESRVYRHPLGVIGVISPWNWPMHLSHRSIAPALALGNAVVVKPSEETPVTGGLLIARIYEEAGLPPGLFNVVVGQSSVIGDAFVQHPVARFISFTGSNRVGRHIAGKIASSSTLKHIALELGGNSPLVVLDDADLERAVHAAVVGRFLHQGQICMSTNRIVVDKTLYADFVDAFVARVARLKVGDPNDENTIIGPLISRRQMDNTLALIESARGEGIAQLLGGAAEGLVLPPHVFGPVSNDARLAQTELFSPIAQIIRADGEADALRIANGTEYGLSSAVFTRDEGRGLRFAQQVQAGMTHINDITVNDSPHNMFGGAKNSGLGRFNGDWIIEAFTTDHWITVQHEPRAYPF
jgi:aldehyde dehydrogenase (NAD+)